MFICICNGQMVQKVFVIMLFFKFCVVICEVLKVEGYIVDYVIFGDVKFVLEVMFKYFEGK